MKKFIALALVTLGVRVGTRAMDVCDPANTVQSVINTAQEIAKYIEMINNQVQQIQTLTDQLNEFRHYERLFGDPKAVVLATVQPLVNDLRKTELGETLAALEGAVDAGEAMLYNANGLFTSIGMNVLNQVREFHKTVPLTGLIVTKLDGTSKGGMVVAIQKELGLPIKFIGLGEQPDDLQPFDARQFAQALSEE